MTSAFQTIGNYWHYVFTDLQDERTRGWFLCGSPIPVVILLIAYQRFVKKSGPEFMKNRKPFNLDRIIQIYNVGQVIACTWLSYEVPARCCRVHYFQGFTITYGPSGYYEWGCQPMDKSLSPAAYRVANICWLYYMLKLTDLLDTIFFLLRKKFNQISFLHVYHHIGVVVLGYMATKYFPDGHGFVLLPLNCFVHIIMYSYYFITNYNPEYKKNIWWKKYITQLQIFQFLFLTYHLGKVFFMSNCEYPKLPIYLYLPQNTLITVLFINFYINTYLKPKKPLKSS